MNCFVIVVDDDDHHQKVYRIYLAVIFTHDGVENSLKFIYFLLFVFLIFSPSLASVPHKENEWMNECRESVQKWK